MSENEETADEQAESEEPMDLTDISGVGGQVIAYVY